MSGCATADQALAFVREHGVVLVSAKGGAPRLTEAIAGAPIKGSWWAHEQGRHIFAILQAVSASDEVLVCRLIDGKVTLVHRRLWPALARIAGRFRPERIARISEQHTPSGRHVSTELAFSQWIAQDIVALAQAVDEQSALEIFGAWINQAEHT